MAAEAPRGLRKAHPLEGPQGFRIVLYAGEHQAAEAGRQILGLDEELTVAPVDRLEQPPDAGVEAAQGRVAR